MNSDKPIGAESIEPETRNDADTYWGYKRLVLTGQDVRKRGHKLLLHYAGFAGRAKIVQISYPTGKAAKRGQMLLRRELRQATSDQTYNRALDAFLLAIAQKRNEPVLVANTPAAPSLERVDPPATKHAPNYVHVHNCQSAVSDPPIPCYFDWSAHEQSAMCPCDPAVNEQNLGVDGTVFIVHQGRE